MKKKVFVAIAAVLLVSLLAVCLAACNPEENEAIASYRDKLQAKGYENFETIDKTDNTSDYTMVWTLSATKNGEGEAPVADYVTIVEFKSEDDAAAYKSDIEAMYAESGATGVVFAQSGKMVYFGTEQGVADAQA